MQTKNQSPTSPPFRGAGASRSLAGAVRIWPRATLLAGALLLLAGQAQAVVVHYSTSLSGAAESPPVTTPGSGAVDLYYDDAAHTLQIVASFSDLIGTTTAAHIHAPTTNPLMGNVGVATQLPSFSGFPLGGTSGAYDHTFDLTDAASFNPSYVLTHGGTAGAEAALIAALNQGRAYLNIHTSTYGRGEIRGFPVTLQVPDLAATAPLLFLGVGGLVGLARVQRIRRP